MPLTTIARRSGTAPTSLLNGRSGARACAPSTTRCSIRPMGAAHATKSIFFVAAKKGAPLLAYIHGGYWQRNAKEFYACLAEGPLARGIDVALIGYTLAPDATLTEIVAEARAALRWLRAQGPGLGLAAEKVIVSGWSAGGHL